MQYPDDFDTTAFPAGRPIAISRVMSIGICVVFVMAAVVCLMILGAVRARQIDPYVVSIDADTNEWTVINTQFSSQAVNTEYVLQESLVARFVQNWFFISDNMDENDGMWGECNVDMCETGSNEIWYGSRKCGMYCMSDDKLFKQFSENIVPDHRIRATAGERMQLNFGTLHISPVGNAPDSRGGTWHVRATIRSNMSAPINVIGYAVVIPDTRPGASGPRMNNGYVVTEFNAYRKD